MTTTMTMTMTTMRSEARANGCAQSEHRRRGDSAVGPAG